jgi:hypothetical protein
LFLVHQDRMPMGGRFAPAFAETGIEAFAIHASDTNVFGQQPKAVFPEMGPRRVPI